MTSYLFLLALIYLITSNYARDLPEITVCKDKVAKHTNRKAIKIVDVPLGSVVNLECHVCNEQDDFQAKVWYFRKRGNRSTAHEVVSSINSETEGNRISINPFHTLQVKHFNLNDSGLYFCKYFTEANKYFTYALDGVYDINSQSKTGTSSDWYDFQNGVVYPTNHFIRNKKGTESSLFPFEITFSWENWGPCVKINNEYIRRRTGKCRIHPIRNKILEVVVLKPNRLSDKLISYLLDSYSVSCRSIELNTYYPKISRVIRNIPEFIMTELCNSTEVTEPRISIKREEVENNFKYNVTKHVPENGHLILICPDITMESEVEWYKDSKLLNYSFRNNMAKSLSEPHITIDAYNALYVLHATTSDEGAYSCTVDGSNMHNFCVKVDPKYKFLNQDFIRHSIYLGFVLSLTMTCYCAGICVAWQRRTSFADPLNLVKRKRNYSFDERERLLKD